MNLFFILSTRYILTYAQKQTCYLEWFMKNVKAKVFQCPKMIESDFLSVLSKITKKYIYRD